jgi:uncharacterized protein DUF4160
VYTGIGANSTSARRSDGDGSQRDPDQLESGPYRFFFYSADQNEPLHVHVERDRATAKFWLEPVHLESSRGFGHAELARIQKLIEENSNSLVRSWHEYFGS